MTEIREKVEKLWKLANLHVKRTRSEMDEKGDELRFFVEVRETLADLRGVHKNSEPTSPAEFEARLRLDALRFRLAHLNFLEFELEKMLNRQCSECRGEGTITYSPDDRDQTKPVTTVCPTCKGVSRKP